MRIRAGLMRISSRIRCQVHALLGEHGVIPPATDLFGKGGRVFLGALTLPPVSQHRLEAASRFDSPERLCSWAGLTPTEHSSAEQTRRGHISKQGSRWLRWSWWKPPFAACGTRSCATSICGSPSVVAPRSRASRWRGAS